MEPTFIFVRHAQGTHNLDHHFIGDAAYTHPRNTDAPLTDHGIDQTEARRKYFDGQEFDVILCSPLRRCRETLLGLYPAAMGKHVILDDRLMEPQGAHICNLRAEKRELMSAVPFSWDLTRVSDVNPYDAGPETRVPFERRITEVTEEICRQWPGKRILLVTHHMWIRHWYRVFYGIEVSVDNCEWVVTGPRKKLTDVAAAQVTG